MDLLERYLQAVKFFLPRAHQDDIIRELSENLTSQIEDRQEELGRALTNSELAEILRRHGHPMLVAGRYRTRQHLIGPVFFPVYVFALKTGLLVALIVTVVLGVINAALRGDVVDQAIATMLQFPGRALMVFAWTTAGFAALDIAQSSLSITSSWDPFSLPKVVRMEYQIPRAHTLCELTFASAAVVWLLLVPNAPFLLLGPAATFVDFGAIWRVVYAPILLVMLATVALYVANFIRPYWTPTRSLAQIGISVGSLIIAVVLMNAGEWFVPALPIPTLPEGTQANRVVNVINVGFFISFIVVAVISLGEILRELFRLKHRRHSFRPHGSAHAGATGD